jgi:hypothetical protein
MCGHENATNSIIVADNNHAEDGKPFIYLCDGEEGGCDRYFVVQIDLIPSVKTYTYDEAKQ